MKTNRNITYRLYPGRKGKAQKLFQIAGACRYVWNHFLKKNAALMNSHRIFNADKPSISFFSLCKEFTQLRNKTEWLRELPYEPVRYVLKYQADAWQRKFAGGGFPKPKSRSRTTPSFTIPEVEVADGWMTIPRVGKMRLNGSNLYEGNPVKSAVVKHICGKWYATLCYEVEIEERIDDGTMVGIDRNVREIALSTGDIIATPDMTKLEIKRKRYQRRMARQKLQSKRRGITKLRVAKLSRKIANKRKNWEHQTSRYLANGYHTVFIEDLDIKGMSASAKGSVEQPGENVKQKQGLNREILNSCWYGLEQNLNYKCGTLIKVEPAYTSQECSKCGKIDRLSRQDKDFYCVFCGHNAHADVNAAKNILALGIGATGRGEALPKGTSASRQIAF